MNVKKRKALFVLTATVGILMTALTDTQQPQAATTLNKSGVNRAQEVLRELNIDGWLLYDFHGHNSVAVDFLGLSGVVTRRSFYFIPAEGEPIGFVHKIEEDKFVDLPGRKITYSNYRILEDTLQKETTQALGGADKKIAMEYSPMGRLPYIGIVDAGTVELIRSFGFDVVSSADIVAKLEAALDASRRALHIAACKKNIAIKDEAFDYIRRKLEQHVRVDEYEVAQFIMRRYAEESMVADHYPIVAVNGYAGNPHYEPPENGSNEIKNGDLILIDMWAKLDKPDGVYSDLCWMGYANGPGHEQPPELFVELFNYVLQAQKAAFDYIKDNFSKGPVYGADADDASRKVITDAGYGEFFTHRTGHSITGEVHGSGPNIDNLETADRRALLPGHVFSLEPGIYNFDAGYGFRSEIAVMMTESGPVVTTTPQQTELLLLFK